MHLCSQHSLISSSSINLLAILIYQYSLPYASLIFLGVTCFLLVRYIFIHWLGYELMDGENQWHDCVRKEWEKNDQGRQYHLKGL